ncbi:MAG: alpha/beta fold hydrolase [Desulforhopalus sp.]
MTIIIIHEIYGLTENLRKLATELEKKGFKVILPSLYSDNYSGTIEEYSYKKYFSEVGFEKSIRSIDRIIEENSKDNIFIIGFSIGATLAWIKSADNRVKGIIGFYGSRIRNYVRITPCIPTRLFFCDEESFDVENLMVELKKKQNTEVTKIPGTHGFYSKSVFNSKLVQETNKRITEELERLNLSA